MKSKLAKKSKTYDVNFLIDGLEKRHCLWHVFEEEYHNREKREAAYAELQEIVNFSSFVETKLKQM